MKCVRCGTPAVREDRCPCCGADLVAMKENTFYLTGLVADSPLYAVLRTSAVIAIAVSVGVLVLGLLLGSISFSLPLFLAALGVLSLGKKQQPSEYLTEQASPAPARLFTASVLLNALSDALTEALCIAVCLGGRNVIDKLLTTLNDAYNTDFYAVYEDAMSQLQMTADKDQFYTAIYYAAVVLMFVFGVGLIANGVELAFLNSYRSSVKTGKVAFSMLRLFSVVLLIRAVFSFVLALSFSLTSLALYGATGFFYLAAYRLTKHVRLCLEE